MFMTVREVISNKLAAVSVRDLLLVEAVAMKRSFRYAAIDMGISTSGLSYQVKKVEEILGQPIFERGSKITPTAFGKEVLDLHCCKVSDEAAFCLIQRPHISKTLLTRRISPRGSP